MPSWGLCWAMLGARWVQEEVQEGCEFEFFDQLGVLTRILTRPEASGMESLGRSFLFLGILGSAGGGGVAP